MDHASKSYDELVRDGAIAAHQPEYITSEQLFDEAAGALLDSYTDRHPAPSLTLLWEDDAHFRVRAHRSEFSRVMQALGVADKQ